MEQGKCPKGKGAGVEQDRLPGITLITYLISSYNSKLQAVLLQAESNGYFKV